MLLSMRDGFHYQFWVYVLSSRTGTLYVGITGFFSRRIHQHKYDSIEGFTKKYQCNRLVYYESHQDVHVAIAREKQIKRWRREKKIALIERVNPRWNDHCRKLVPRNEVPGTIYRGNSLNRHRGARILGISPLLLTRFASSSSVEMTDPPGARLRMTGARSHLNNDYGFGTVKVSPFQSCL